MSFPKNKIQVPFFSLLILLFATTIVHSQKISASGNDLDTSNLVVRICQGDLPGQKKDLTADYPPTVCAYTYNNNKVVTYTVAGFDLVYKDTNNGSMNVASGKGNQLTISMKAMIVKADNAIQNLFFDNIALINKEGEKLLIKGLRPLVPDK